MPRNLFVVRKVEFVKKRIDYVDMESKNMALNGTKLNIFETFSVDEGVGKGYWLSEAPDDIIGGYLLEHDYDRKYYSEYIDEEPWAVKYVIEEFSKRNARISEFTEVPGLFVGLAQFLEVTTGAE